MISLVNVRHIFRAIVGAAVFSAVQLSHAVVVLPVTSASLSGTTVAANPDLAGVVLYDNLVPFQLTDENGDVFVQGVVQDRVVRSDNTGGLVFAPRLRDLTTTRPGSLIEEISLVGFEDSFSMDIDFRIDGLGDVGPTDVLRAVPGVTRGDLDFRYGSGLFPPDEGKFISVLTDATAFDNRGRIIIVALTPLGVSTVTRLDNTTSPVVPVPAAAWLFGSGLIGLCGARFKKGSIRISQTI